MGILDTILSTGDIALEAEFDVFKDDTSFDDNDRSLEHPGEPRKEEEPNPEEETQNNNDPLNPEEQNTEEDPEQLDEGEDVDVDNNVDEELPEEDATEEEQPPEDSTEMRMKLNIKENMIRLFDILVTNLESLNNSKFRPEYDTEKLLTIIDGLMTLKEIVYKTLNQFNELELYSLTYKYQAMLKVYDIYTEMLMLYTNEGITNENKKQQHDNKSKSDKSDKKVAKTDKNK